MSEEKLSKRIRNQLYRIAAKTNNKRIAEATKKDSLMTIAERLVESTNAAKEPIASYLIPEKEMYEIRLCFAREHSNALDDLEAIINARVKCAGTRTAEIADRYEGKMLRTIICAATSMFYAVKYGDAMNAIAMALDQKTIDNITHRHKGKTLETVMHAIGSTVKTTAVDAVKMVAKMAVNDKYKSKSLVAIMNAIEATAIDLGDWSGYHKDAYARAVEKIIEIADDYKGTDLKDVMLTIEVASKRTGGVGVVNGIARIASKYKGKALKTAMAVVRDNAERGHLGAVSKALDLDQEIIDKITNKYTGKTAEIVMDTIINSANIRDAEVVRSIAEIAIGGKYKGEALETVMSYVDRGVDWDVWSPATLKIFIEALNQDVVVEAMRNYKGKAAYQICYVLAENACKTKNLNAVNSLAKALGQEVVAKTINSYKENKLRVVIDGIKTVTVCNTRTPPDAIKTIVEVANKFKGDKLMYVMLAIEHMNITNRECIEAIVEIGAIAESCEEKNLERLLSRGSEMIDKVKHPEKVIQIISDCYRNYTGESLGYVIYCLRDIAFRTERLGAIKAFVKKLNEEHDLIKSYKGERLKHGIFVLKEMVLDHFYPTHK